MASAASAQPLQQEQQTIRPQVPLALSTTCLELLATKTTRGKMAFSYRKSVAIIETNSSPINQMKPRKRL